MYMKASGSDLRAQEGDGTGPEVAGTPTAKGGQLMFCCVSDPAMAAWLAGEPAAVAEAEESPGRGPFVMLLAGYFLLVAALVLPVLSA
jgi:hypothetical protein